jgi:AmmeMemoRadiSam system protein A
MELSTLEKKQLFSLAHFSIESGFRPTQKSKEHTEQSDKLKLKAGVFVTITINEKLRGCIGYIQSEDELSKTVMDAAYQAAFHDPRFAPLSEEEFGKIKLEISVLSPPFPLGSYDEIEIGKHGLILEEAGRKALLLPQVPIEHKMDREGFLSALCNKAGLNEDYWKEKQLKIKAFTANVFSEDDEELK